MMRKITALLLGLGVSLGWLGISPAAAQSKPDSALVKDTLKKLNSDDSVTGTEDSKSYKILFDAYLELTKPPFIVGPDFNLNTIHPKMSTWSAVSGWAESNNKMAQAILKCKDKNINGLPYGREKADPAWVKAGITADVAVGGSLRNLQFPYLNVVDTIAAFATAETYRLMEAGQTQQALDLAIAHCFVLRQLCDREFLAEKLHSIELLSSALGNLRDVMYLYQDKITAEQFTTVASKEVPYLRPDRARLFMPEADRVVAEALIREVFNAKDGSADADKFTQTFAEIQSRDLPLTRFGAAKRWRLIAAVHGSLDASLQKLQDIYDDWWRRWRIKAYDPILAVPTEFDRTNPIRYAAVMYSARDIAVLFEIRNRLRAEVNGTAMAAGLCGYKKTFATYPDLSEKTYTQFDKKSSDEDPFDKELAPFKYRMLDQRKSIDTAVGRVWVEKGEALLYSKGQDHEDGHGDNHTDDGASGDLVIWPPVKSLTRAAKLVQ